MATVRVECTCGRNDGAIHADHCPVSIINDLLIEIRRQDEKHGRYEGTDLGRSRLALATLEDEVREAVEAWREERRFTNWTATRAEVMQVAAVSVRTLRDAL